MREVIIIKTNESKKIRNILNQEGVNYEIYQEPKEPQKISEEELGQAYQEAWSNPRRLAEAKQWEQATIDDWAERVKKEKK